MQELIEIVLHTDDALMEIVAKYGEITYVILFLIIFSETGLVVFPFLPGDGLLLSAGVIASTGSLNILILLPMLILAAILGNILNYRIGRTAGRRILKWENDRFKRYMIRTRAFYIKHGGKAVLISRFFPVLRTYVPFVAGITVLEYKRFFNYSSYGAIIWVLLFAFGGYLVGEIPWVQKNYGLLFLLLIVLTLIPFFVTGLRSFFSKKR